MYRPPAVSYSVVRSRWHARTLGVLWALGAVLVQATLWRYDYSMTAMVAMEFSCLAAGLWAVWAWRTAPQGLLRWDGDCWHWSGYAEMPVRQVTVHFDFQAVVLVSVQGLGRVRVWLWLDSASVTHARWLALRRALVAGGMPPPQAGPLALPNEQLP
ncbi:hypothetical protein [Rhodoferax saidenbachensis]|uniref:Toxin CptA n=1 Tax=Rhodoferax saidenbachensis TaxID=1484693 RepID=A0ABU1ZLK0_9BURK|nr:hypothetical protein [Rhodoferax saidenbachensis]MDR7306418.1 hypothetical protein [Rhodoferax saidenbachensis]